MTRAERRTLERQRWSRMQAEELAELARYIDMQPLADPRYGRAAGLSSVIKGLRGRTTDRAARLEALAHTDAAQAAWPGEVSAILRALAPWTGTAADLLKLLPCRSGSASALTRRLRTSAHELAGITIEHRRVAGIGARLLVVSTEPRDTAERISHE